MSRAASPANEPPLQPREGALARHRSTAQLKLEALQKEHERLLRDIARKRTSRDLTEQAARDAACALESRIAPVRVALAATFTELKGIFALLLGDGSRLGRRDKARVRRLYFQILPELASALDDEANAATPDEPEFRNQRNGGSSSRTNSEHAAADAGYSARKPGCDDAGLLRTLFRRLAVALHPDKVRDAEACAQLTAVMKQVTCAYESGDLARLVELERIWLADAPRADSEAVDEITRQIERLLAANKDLRRQLRALNAELKELKQSLPSSSDRRAKGPPDFKAAIEEIVDDMQSELGRLETLRDFAASFLRGEVTLEEFLLGPPLGHDPAESLDQLFADVLSALMDDEDSAPSRRRRRKPRA